MTDGKDKHPESEFESRVQQALESGAGDVAPEVAERLAAMRGSAVAELDERAARRRGFAWGPASAFSAALATVALATGLFLFSGNGSDAVMPEISDEPEFAAVRDLELLTELEFLAWLEEEESDAG